MKRVAIDTETTGVNPWAGDRAVGMAVATPEGSFYLPWAHGGGGNYDKQQVLDWAKDELRDVTVAGLNMKFDERMSRLAGIDLLGQGCKLEEVSFAAALLDSNTRSFTLDSLADRHIGARKLDMPVAPERLHQVHSSQAAEYARADAHLTLKLAEKLVPQVQVEDGLREVYDLEMQLLPVVSAMEDEGCYIDEELLDKWLAESERELAIRQGKLNKMVGRQLNVGSHKQLCHAWLQLGLPTDTISSQVSRSQTTSTGGMSFQAEILYSVGHEFATLLAEAKDIKSLRTKFLLNYKARLESGGKLRFNLHQMKCTFGGALTGTVTGRFSSSDVNIQQIPNPVLQAEVTKRWPIVKLFVPPKGRLFYETDASQIEFRLLAHYCASFAPALADAYRENPDTDFHQFVCELTNLHRRYAKNVSFARVYGGGIPVVMRFLKCDREKAIETIEAYDAKFPYPELLKGRVHERVRQLGYTATILGRRRHYPNGPDNSSLNALIQGSAADLMKLQLVRIPEVSKEFGTTAMFTVHDAITGHAPLDFDKARFKARMDEVLCDTVRVPITWDVDTGANWYACKEE